MISKSWLLAIWLMIVFLPESLSQNCDQLRKTLLEDNKENVKLLTSKMGPTFPRQCLGEIIKFSSSPGEERALNIQEIQNEDVETAIYEIIKQVLHIFNQNSSQLSWDDNSLTVFKLGLDQQIEKVRSCVNKEQCTEVKKFFDRINTFLEKHQYSLCAWEIVQIEINQAFIMMNQLIRKLPEEALVLEPETSSETSPEAVEEKSKEKELSEVCSQMKRKIQDANKANLELLNNNMKSTVARVCLGDIVNFFSNPNEANLPKPNEFQGNNVTEAIYEILQQISTVFGQNHTQLPWDEDSVTVFQLGLDQELEILQPCLKLGPVTEKVKQKLMKYFQRINDLLKDKKYNQCAWEITQIEVRHCLIMLNEFFKKLQEEDTTELPDLETFMREQLDKLEIRRKRRKRSSTSASGGFFL